MSAALDAFRRQVEDMHTRGRSPSEMVLEVTLEHAEPAVAQAIWYCAIPRWFNLEVVDALRPHHRTEPAAQTLMNELLALPFVREFTPFGYTYHESTRQSLLARWRREDPSSFVAWNRRALRYFEGRLKTTTTSRFGAIADPGVVVLPETERTQFQRERIYHLLVVDPVQGFQEFQDLFREAERNRQFSEMQTLLTEVKARAPHLSTYRLTYIAYYEGVLALRSGRRQEAGQVFQSLLSQVGPSRLRSKLLYRLGELALADNNPAEAVRLYTQCLELCQSTQCHPWEFGRALRDLGSAYQALGDWEEAQRHYRRSLEMWQRSGDQLGIVETYNDLGNLYLSQHRPEQALEYYQQSLALLHDPKDRWRVGRIFNNLGNYYSDRHQWEQALAYYTESLEVKSQLGDAFGIATTYYNIATVYLGKGHEAGKTRPLSRKAQGLFEKAVEYFEDSLAIFRGVGDRSAMAQALYYLASLYRILDRPDDALHSVGEAIYWFRNLESDDLEEAEKLRNKLAQQA